MPLKNLLDAVVMGVGATLCMDLWNGFLKLAFGVPSLNYCLLGRWIGHMPGGTFWHAGIAAAAPKPFECALGRIAHYSIGVALALGFTALAPRWPAHPTPLPALAYGVATVVFPFFLMQPALGLGVASAKTPQPMRARLKSLATHTVYGLGLYGWGLGLNWARAGLGG